MNQMLATSADPRHAPQAHDVDHVRHLVEAACEPVSQLWPLKRFTYHSPVFGLEHLPFDQAVREGERLIGGKGYLANAEYRRFAADGRIAGDAATTALRRFGPPADDLTHVVAGARRIDAAEVWRAQLLFGFAPLEPLLLAWTVGPSGSLSHMAPDLPAASRQRLLDRLALEVADRGRSAEEGYVRALWEACRHATSRDVDPATADATPAASDPAERPVVALPPARTVGDWLEALTGEPFVEPVNAQVTRWVAAFVDEGMAGWTMPGRAHGFYQAWRTLAPRDWSGQLLGIRNFAVKVRALPERAEEAIGLALERLAVPNDRSIEYLTRHLAQLPGWAGLIRYLAANPSYPGGLGHPIDPAQYLAVRLFYEAELADAFCRRTWQIPGTVPAIAAYWEARGHEDRHLGTGAAASNADDLDVRVACDRTWPLFRLAQFLELLSGDVRTLAPAAVDTLLAWLAAFPEDRHGAVWLDAYEDGYRQRLVALLTTGQRQPVPAASRPRAQILFCIDVRSESFRRHVEALGAYDTYGYAGFFGIPMNHVGFDADERYPLCPVLLTPRHDVDETVRPQQERSLAAYASGSRWLTLADHLFHDLKQHPLSSLMLVDVLGFVFGAGLAGKTLAPGVQASVTDTVTRWFRHPVATRVAVDAATANAGGAGPLGFSLAEQTGIVEGGLRAIGLTRDFGRFVVLCGHGSVSDNNPYFGALHCGACGGKHGDASARGFAAMANHPEVRAELLGRGIRVPDDTWFLAAKHITTSDRVDFYDVQDVPASHRDELAALHADLAVAGAAQAFERSARLPRAGSQASPEQAYAHVQGRTTDWANTRPEWGLSSNAAFIIARRGLTRGRDLQGRAFLHSYDPGSDPDGAILEKIMMAPLVVGQWINMAYYFSAVDPWVWGSGSKVIHNVVAGVGVMPGSQGDLQTGLPVQSVNDGARHYHEPMRLLAVIEAPPARIASVIARQTLLQRLFHNGWLNLVAIEPPAFQAHRYHTDGTWEPLLTAPRTTEP